MRSPRSSQPPVSPGYGSRNNSERMTETETRTQQQAMEARRLALTELQTVKWIASQASVKRIYDGIKPRYQTLRQTTILGWFVVIFEAVMVWWWTFLHNLPWPQTLLALLEATDSRVVAILDLAQQKIEWWWDASGVRLMWLRESLLTSLDYYLTKIDALLLRVQDAVISAITYLLMPVARLYRRIVPATKAVNRPRRRDEHESDLNEDEDTEFGDDYLSDASTDSRRLLKTGGVSYGRQCTTAMAEGRFREAMYHRVKKELSLMRKNSIRFSYDIVTYAKQMVEPRVQPYAVSFQASYQKWAREHEIQETMKPLLEEWNTNRPPLAKMLSLAQALCVVCLAFLLRLAKGKKSRRTRSMRSESLRRRAQNLACTNNSQLSLSPTALQQSSEPTPSHHLVVPESLQEPALKEDDEYLDGSPAKDSALGSEDNRSDQLDSDHTISPIHEERDSEEDSTTTTATAVPRNGANTKNKNASPVTIKQEGQVSPKQKKGVTIMTPEPTKNHGYKKSSKFNKKVTTII